MTGRPWYRAVQLSICLVAAMGQNAAAGGVDFGTSSGPLHPHFAADDSDDDDTRLATDGAGVWIVAWQSGVGSLGITGPNGPAVSRSLDNGLTWSLPTVPRPEFTDGTGSQGIATNGSGTWILAWADFDADLEITRSTDDGATWNAPQLVDGLSVAEKPSIAADGVSTWVLAWVGGVPSGAIGDRDVLFSRSVDDGVTWTAPALLDADGAVDGRVFEGAPRLATDGAGTWVAVWGDTETILARSTDNGATWGAPTELSTNNSADGNYVDIATDGMGRWLAAWTYIGVPGAFEFSRSTDNGATWSVAQRLHPVLLSDNPSGHLGPSISIDSGGEWRIAWQGGSLYGALGTMDYDILISSSRDAGATWSGPAAIVTDSMRDGSIDDIDMSLAAGANGRTVAVWGSGNFPVTDEDIHFATATRDCEPLARVDCRTSIDPDGSRLRIRDSLSGGDRLSWSLKAAQATSDADLGNPLVSDDYVVCLYEKLDGAPALIGEWDAKAGTTCRNSQPCWQGEPGEVELRDSGNLQGAIKKLRVRGGASGEAEVLLKSTGPTLGPPRLPLDMTSPVRIQLVNLGTNVCWEGVHDQASRNEDGRFASTSD